jgi:hypothetical protein
VVILGAVAELATVVVAPAVARVGGRLAATEPITRAHLLEGKPTSDWHRDQARCAGSIPQLTIAIAAPGAGGGT